MTDIMNMNNDDNNDNDNDNNDNGCIEGNDRQVIKLRGLPWNVNVKEIMEFLKDVEVADGEKGIHMAISPRDGRPNGEAFVECASEKDFNKAFEYNKNILGHRYIEIFNAKLDEFEHCLQRQNLVQHDTFIKLRGLPYSCKPEDIEQFFEGLEIRNQGQGIHIVFDSRGRATGEAFVQFTSPDDTEKALKKNREKIGHRYIEIFRSSSSECRRTTIFSRPGGGNGNGGNGGGNGFDGNNRGGNGNGFGGGMGGNMGGGGGGGGGGRGGMGGRGNNRNFRDRPYPDSPWSQDAPWRNRGNFGGNNNSGGGGNSNFGGNNDNFGGNSGGGNNGGGGGNNNLFNNDNFNNDSFERKWNAGSGNGFNSFNPGSNSNSSSGGGNGGGGNFDRDTFSGLNNYGNNSNNNSGGGGGGGGNNNFGGNNNNGNNNFGMSNNGNNGGGGGGSGNGGGGGNGNNFMVHLRGMPFDCGEKEIYSFFEPLNLVGCEVIYNNQGRHTGEADAFFGTVEECQEAMKKHKEKMGSRYIELFANKNIGDKRGGGSDGGRRF